MAQWEAIATRFEIWRSIDDGITCPTCRALEGKIFPENAGPTPPLHPHCRCQRIYHHTSYQVGPRPDQVVIENADGRTAGRPSPPGRSILLAGNVDAANERRGRS